MVQMFGAENSSYIHGLTSKDMIGSGHPLRSLYLRWQNMKARCHQPTNKDYHRYGAVGITVCDRWRYGEHGTSGFVLFLQDMGPPPFDGASLDRIDPTQGYTPNNVRWATMEEQTANKRNIKWLTIEGVSKPLTVWAREVGIGPKTIHYRLKRGLSHKDAVFMPTDRGRNLPKALCSAHNGDTQGERQ